MVIPKCTYPVKMDGMLGETWFIVSTSSLVNKNGRHLLLTGLPGAPPGKEISITLLGGRTNTDPGGSNSCGVDAPLII